MPWTAADAEGHTKKADTSAKQKTWAQIANKERQRCIDEGGDAKGCDARAIRVANEAVANIKEGNMKEYKAHTMSTNNVLISVNAIDVEGEPVPVAELVAAYREQRGQGQGVGGDRQGDGGADVCVCPKCGREYPHEKGTPCNEMECGDCGVALVGQSETGEVAEATTKTVDGKNYPSSDFLVVEDPKKPSTWHLQVKRNGKPDHGLMGGAKAALTAPGGHRGNKYEGPNKQEAIRKLKALYNSEDMPWGKETSEADIVQARELLEQALAVLGSGDGEEMAEAELCESVSFESFMPEGDHSAAILDIVKEAGVTPGKGRRAPVVVDLQIIKPGPGNKKDNRYYPSSTLKNYAHVFEGADVFVTDHKAKERSEKTKVGRVRSCPVRFTETGGPVGRTVVYDPDMAEKIRNRADADELHTLHCSIYGKGDVRPGKVDGKDYGIVESINDGVLVEFVSKAGAGGHARNLVENDAGGANMLDKEKVEGLLSESDLPQEVQERLAGAEYESEEAVKEAILKEKAQGAPRVLAEAEVEKLVEATKLPGFAKIALKVRDYEDEAALEKAIAETTEDVKKLTGSGQVFGQGGGAGSKDQPLSEKEKTIRFNRHLEDVGGRPVPVPAEQ